MRVQKIPNLNHRRIPIMTQTHSLWRTSLGKIQVSLILKWMTQNPLKTNQKMIINNNLLLYQRKVTRKEVILCLNLKMNTNKVNTKRILKVNRI